jgi:hypothetical protein
LEQIYGSLKQPGTASKESLKAFDQAVFFAVDVSAQMDEHGHVYAPKACSDGTSCKLHVAKDVYRMKTRSAISFTRAPVTTNGLSPTISSFYTFR